MNHYAPSELNSTALWQAIEALVTLYDEAIFGYAHSVAVSRHTVAIAQSLGWTREKIDALRLGALLHDIGHAVQRLSVIQDNVVDEPELRVKQHPTAGGSFIQRWPIVADLALHVIQEHQEWWDGRGYPNGLRADDIGTDVQLTSFCDLYVSLRHPNRFRNRDAYSYAQAIEIMSAYRGARWQESCFDTFAQEIGVDDLDV